MTIEEHAPSGLGEVESLMLKKIAITALVAMLSCAALAEAHPRYGWKDRPSEKFELSNRAKRKLPLQIVPIGSSDNTLINMHLTAQFPVTLSVQNARGDSLGTCYYAQITGVAANCSIRWDNMPKYIVVEDSNQAELMEGTRGRKALNRISLEISEYTCVKSCTKQ